MRKVIIMTLTAMFLVGCATNFKSSGLVLPKDYLTRGAEVVIGTSANGAFGEERYPESGAAVSMAIQQAFSKYTNAAKISASCADAGCLDRFAKSPRSFLVVPEILRWEDRMTRWSGQPDQVEIKMTVYAAKSRRVVASGIVYGASPSQTLADGHPEDLALEAVQQFIRQLYSPR